MTRSIPFSLVVASLLSFPTTAPRAHSPADRVSTGDVVIEAGQRVEEVVSIDGSVKLESGAQAKQVTAIMGSVELQSGATVEDEVVAIGGDIRVGSGARIGGEAVSVGGKMIVEPGGVVEGQRTSISLPFRHGKWPYRSWFPPPIPHSPFWTLGQMMAQFATFFALGLLLLVFFPKRLEGVASSIEHGPSRDFAVGLLGTVAIPVLALLLVVTLIGILLVPLEMVAVAAAGLFGFTALSLAIARRLPIRVARTTPALQLAIGTAIVVLLTHLPVIGCVLFVLGWFLAFGAVLRTRFGKPEAANGGSVPIGTATPSGPTPA